jgi:hypothetical protein
VKAFERFLVELGTDCGPAAPTGSRSKATADTRAPTAVAADLEQAFERGRATAAAEAEEALAARLREAEHAVEGRIAAARADWVAQESARLAGRLEAALREIDSVLTDAVARILKPFLVERVRAEAVETLAATIADVVRHRDGARVEIAGAADLTAAVAERIGALGIGADVREAEGCDVRVSIGLTALETSLAAWMTRIEEAVR